MCMWCPSRYKTQLKDRFLVWVPLAHHKRSIRKRRAAGNSPSLPAPSRSIEGRAPPLSPCRPVATTHALNQCASTENRVYTLILSLPGPPLPRPCYLCWAPMQMSVLPPPPPPTTTGTPKLGFGCRTCFLRYSGTMTTCTGAGATPTRAWCTYTTLGRPRCLRTRRSGYRS